MSDERTIRVPAMTRVEGEGGLTIRLRANAIDAIELNIFEPPRMFEALLRGRRLEEAPDINARICGICPVAYQMSTVHALEAALGIEVTPEIRRLRRLLYCGEWIESHALHVHLLHAPDFLGYESSLAMAADHPQLVTRGLQLKKQGNRLLEVLGGRAVHPINVAVGGFYRLPRRAELTELVPALEAGLQDAIEATRWVAGFSFPNFEQNYDFVALANADEYPMCAGTIRSSHFPEIAVGQFEAHFDERQVPHSTALHSRRTATGGTYFVGPLARINHNRERLSPAARRIADEVAFELPCRNPFRGIVARSIEIVHAFEEALAIIADYRPREPARVPYAYAPAEGAAATEAPRGLLYHRYAIDESGLIREAIIVPPTSQNQGRIEDDLRAYLPSFIDRPDPEVAASCEQFVRAYDPCISCASHFLRVRVERRP